MKCKRILLGFVAVLIFNLFSFTASAEGFQANSPIMVSSEPQSGEEVPVDKIMCVIFNENIDKGASFSKITLKDYSDKIIPANIEIEKDMLIITPKGYLIYDNYYILTIPVRAVKNKLGNSLRNSITLKFKTEIKFKNAKPQPKIGVFELDKIYTKAEPAVVSIESENTNGIPLKQGSGLFISEDGKILTNYHVIYDGGTITVKCSNGKVYNKVEKLFVDESRDIAVLKIDGEKVPYIEFGDSDSIITGQKVAAIGSPEGLENTISDGIISNRLRVLDGLNYIQTNTAVSHGSSGGPLLDSNARAIGIMVYSLNKDGAQNLNLAIPINEIRQIVNNVSETSFAVTNPVLTPIEAEAGYLHFFESGYNPPKRGERTYDVKFPQKDTRYINWELGITYKAPGTRQSLKLSQRFLKPDGSVLYEDTRNSAPFTVEAGWTSSNYSWSCGWPSSGKWDTGIYKVEIWINDKNVANDTFEITK